MSAYGLHNLQNPGRTAKKRLGRGTGSGLGTTAGRGTKGQNSRSGGGVRPRFEGGHTPLYRLTPKLRGFTSRFVKPAILNLNLLDAHCTAGEMVKPHDLVTKGLIPAGQRTVKLLGAGEINKKLTIYVSAASKSAIAKIEKAGGKVVLPKPAKPAPKKGASKKSVTPTK